MKITIDKTVLALYFLVIGMVLVVLFFINRTSEKAISSSDLITHTHEVRHMSDNVLLDILNIESGFRGYLLTRNELFLEHYYRSSTSIINNLEAIGKFTEDNPEQHSRITEIAKTSIDRLTYLDKIIDLTRQGALKEKDITEILLSGKIVTEKLRTIISNINLTESKLLKQRNIDYDLINKKIGFMYFGLLALAVFFCTLIVVSIIRQQAKSQIAVEQKQSSRYARSLIEASLDPLVTISSQGKITDVNEALIIYTGIPRTELVGTNFSNFFTEAAKAQEGYLKTFENGFVQNYPLTIKHTSGKLTDVLYNASVYKDDAGNVLGVFAAARDVTEQKLTKANLEASLKEISDYKYAFDQFCIVAITDQRGIIQYVNDNFCTISKYTRDELIGQDHRIINSRYHSKEFLQNLWTTIASGNIWKGELRNKAKDGTIYWVDTTIVPFLNEQGKPYKYVAVRIDITAKKQYSQYTRSLIEASVDPLVTINVDGMITDVNEASITITGTPRNELIGTNFSNYFTEPEQAEAGYRHVFEEGFVADYPLTIKHRNGKLTDVLYNASVYKDDSGKVLGVFAAARDVTEQKLLSKYSLSLIEASHDPLVTISEAGKITDMNEATVKITGIMRDKLAGTDFFDYFTESQKAREVYQEVFAKGFVIDSPLTLRHKDGKLTDVLFNGSVYKDDIGNVLGVVVVARDITDQNRFRNELIEAKGNAELATQKAEESNKLKESFLANMSHEIRTPMNAIIGFSDILSKRGLGEQERDFVAIIKAAGENLLTIINDILDISKIEAGMMTFESHTFSVKEIFASLQVMLMEKAKEKNLDLIFSSSESVPAVLMGDNTRLTQIIINLVGNAIKFTQKGRVEVSVEVLTTDQETVVLEFAIRDTGIGIPQEKLDTIFGRFIQAESNTTREYGGTGLGLSIAKQLAELQGGNLTVESIVGMGSVFTLRIPYKRSTKMDMVLPTFETNYNMEAFSNLKVLLIEDNKMNVKLILSLFSEYNLDVEVAWNGREGVEKLKAGHFDIVLMDMEMPVMNGYEAATIIRKEMKDTIPIIAMTAHAMAGEREKCLSLGMNDYLSKPVNSKLLFEKMYSLTRSLPIDDNQIVRPNHQKVCDLSYLTQVMAGKKKLIRGVIDEFLLQVPTELILIKDAVNQKDFAMLKNLAHAMKSSVSIMSISSLTEILNEIENLGTKGLDMERIKVLHDELNTICTSALKELEEEKVNYSL